MEAPRELEPKETIWGNVRPWLAPWINSLGSSCLGANIWCYLGCQCLRKLCWQCSTVGIGAKSLLMGGSECIVYCVDHFCSKINGNSSVIYISLKVNSWCDSFKAAVTLKSSQNQRSYDHMIVFCYDSTVDLGMGGGSGCSCWCSSRAPLSASSGCLPLQIKYSRCLEMTCKNRQIQGCYNAINP